MRKRHLWLEMLILASMIVYIIENPYCRKGPVIKDWDPCTDTWWEDACKGPPAVLTLVRGRVAELLSCVLDPLIPEMPSRIAAGGKCYASVPPGVHTEGQGCRQ